MRLDDQFEEESSAKGTSFMLTAVISVGLFLVVVFGIVIFVNRDALFHDKPSQSQVVTTPSEDTSSVISGSTLVSDDLDIWDDYPVEEEKSETVSEIVSETPSEDDPSEGGTKTLVTFADGKEQWYSISKYLPQNEYDDTGFVMGNGRMAYYVEGNKESYLGIDISKYQGYIDFNEVKKDGVDFVIIKLGSRGYSTGQLTLDDYFQDNIKRATDAGLEVGVSFSSQAITVDEAKEEAAFVLEKIAPYRIECPVVFDVEKVSGDDGRMNGLSVEERTKLTLLFCQTIENAGYKPMIYHNMEMGALMLDIASLEQYDKWFAYYNEDMYYPYAYKIWQYSDEGVVDGIQGPVDLNISFEPLWE